MKRETLNVFFTSGTEVTLYKQLCMFGQNFCKLLNKMSFIFKKHFSYWEIVPCLVKLYTLHDFCLCKITTANDIQKWLRQALHCPTCSTLVGNQVSLDPEILNATFGSKKVLLITSVQSHWENRLNTLLPRNIKSNPLVCPTFVGERGIYNW